MLHYLVLFLGLFALTLPSWCQPTTIDIESSSLPKIIPGKYLEVFEDETKNLKFTDVQVKKFETAQFIVPNFGFKNSSYWFKFNVHNNSNKLTNYIIQVKNPNLDIVSLTAITATHDTITQITGDHFPYEKRLSSGKYFDFKHSFLPGETILFYLNVQNSGEQFHSPIYIGESSRFSIEESNEQVIFGFYFGIILFAILLNLFFYIVLKDRSTIYYILYLIGLFFLQLSLTGLGYKYIWYNSVFLANHANPIFANFSIFFLIWFSLLFLKVNLYLPRLAKFYRYLSFVVLLGTLSATINTQAFYIFSVLSINVIALILNICIIPTSIYIHRKGYKPARFFTIAFVVLILSVFLFVFKNFGILPPGWLTEYGLQIGSAAEVLLLTLAIIDRFKQFKDEALKNLEEVNLLKTDANIKLEKKVEERTAEIQQKKLEIEEKNLEILGSIRYAKRIQEAILPNDELLKSKKIPHFVLYLPRDIVSGDFYWFQQPNDNNENELLLAVADCTGHGVPGAFMSILGMNYLKQSLQELTHIKPAYILDYVNKKVIETLNQSPNDSKVRDGMDISLILFDYKNRKLQFAGANNPIYLVRNGALIEIKSDKQAIGSVGEEVNKYTNHIIDIQKGDLIYLFSDGYADQFGGPDFKKGGKKLKYSRLKELLVENAQNNLQTQMTNLKNELMHWRIYKENNTVIAEYEQTDDVCIIGLLVE